MRMVFCLTLPRSRSAWLSNFLTTDTSIVFHEAISRFETLDEYFAFLDSQPKAIVGDCGAALIEHWEAIAKRYPEATWVVVNRPVEDVCKSQAAAFPNHTLELAFIRALADKLKELDSLDHYAATFDMLEREEVCMGIWDACLGLPWDSQRWKLLDNFRITVMAEKAVQSVHPNLRRAISRSTKDNPTLHHTRYMALLQSMCSNDPMAYAWLCQVFDLALTLDHLVDNDPLDVERAEACIESVLLNWPFNQFYQRNSAMLAPVLSNVIGAWRCSNGNGDRHGQYQLYTELPSTVAFLLGGAPLRDRFCKPIRELVQQEIAEDNKRDGQGDRQ